MTTEPDRALEQYRYRRMLFVWRAVAVGSFLCMLLLATGLRTHRGTLHNHLPHIARVRVDGVIGSDVRHLTDALRDAQDNPAVKAVILDINSPGGAVTGGEMLHDAVANCAAHKPVVVLMEGLAASAGYMIAVPAQRIFAQRSTLTGSIGVLMQAPDFSGLLGKVGVNVDELVSAPLKGQPSGVKPLSPEGHAMLQGVIDELYGQFVTMVAQGRHMSETQVRGLADGRPYTGAHAVTLGLVDQIGDEQDVRAWLQSHDHISLALPVRDIGKKKQGWLARHAMAGTFGQVVQSIVSSEFLGQRLELRGPVALLDVSY